MQLISVLASGVRGAELGTAKLFKRGTSTRATWYASFEGEGSNATGDDIDLDSNGGATVFVAELVYVVVYAPAATGGGIVRDFVAGNRDDAVEVETPSFTGVDYDTGQSGLNEPTTLGLVLDLVVASFGSTDWNVLVAGQSVSVADALAGTALFVNVKSPRFGAVGDGIEDDTAAIQAALDYGFLVGIATVYFPPGTYLISDVLSVPPGVNMLGNGTLGFPSEIERATSDDPFVAQDALIPSNTVISHLKFLDGDTGTNEPFINVTNGGGSKLIMEFCEFVPPGNAATGGSPCFNDDAGIIELRNCTFTLRGADGRVIDRTGTGLSEEIIMLGCTVNISGNIAYSGAYVVSGTCRLVANLFHANFTTGLTPPAAVVSPYAPSTVLGNKFTKSITDAMIAILADGTAGAATANAIVESGNLLDADTWRIVAVNSGNMLAQSLFLRRLAQTIAAPGTLNITSFGGYVAVTTTGIAGTYVMAFTTLNVPLNTHIDIVVRNTTGANHLIDFTNTSPADVGVAVNAGLILRARYVYMTVGATTSWFRQTAFTVTAV